MNSEWKLLEKDLTDWLSCFANDGVKYRNPYQAILGFPTDGFRSDGMLANDDTLLAIEVEAGQNKLIEELVRWIIGDFANRYKLRLNFVLMNKNGAVNLAVKGSTPSEILFEFFFMQKLF